MTSRIIQILISNFDIYHGEFDLNINLKLNNEKEKLIEKINNFNFNPSVFFEIYEYLDEVFQIYQCLNIFEWIIENSNNSNLKNIDKNGNTILHIVAKSLKRTNKKEKHEIAKFLIENGCDKTIKNNDNKTAMEIAKENYKNFDEENIGKLSLINFIFNIKIDFLFI